VNSSGQNKRCPEHSYTVKTNGNFICILTQDTKSLRTGFKKFFLLLFLPESKNIFPISNTKITKNVVWRIKDIFPWSFFELRREF